MANTDAGVDDRYREPHTQSDHENHNGYSSDAEAQTDSDVHGHNLHSRNYPNHDASARLNTDVNVENVNQGPGMQFNHDQSRGLRNRQYNAQVQNIYYRIGGVATALSSKFSLSDLSDIGRDALSGSGGKQEGDDTRSIMQLLQSWKCQLLTISSRRSAHQVLGVLVFLVALCYGLVLTIPPLKPEPFQPSLNASLPVFAILGKTGIGKSTFINTLGGQNLSNSMPPEICDSLESCTESVSFYRADLSFGSVYLIDTPGFDDSKGRDDQMILEMIFEELRRLYRGEKLVKGVIYLYDISAPRIGGSTIELLLRIRDLCGSHDASHLMLVTTRWAKASNDPDYKKQQRRARELKEVHWADAIKHGSEIQPYHGTKESAEPLLGLLNSRQRSFEPLNMDLAQDYQRREASKAQNLDNKLCPAVDSVSVLSVWGLRSATAICSAPWWTALVLVLKSSLVWFWQCCTSFVIFEHSRYLFTERYVLDTNIGKRCLIAIALTGLLNGRSMARFDQLTDAGCAACLITTMHIHELPTLVFGSTPALILYFLHQQDRRFLRSVWPLVPWYLLQYLHIWYS